MADHDPMDLNVRSQAFYQQFYLHHKNSCDAWYIKDANHVYVDASISFLSRFLPSGMNSVIGLDDMAITSASERNIRLMHDFENHAMKHNKVVTLFSWNYLSDRDDVKAFVFRIEPFPEKVGEGIIIYAYDLAAVNNSVKWLSALITRESSSHHSVSYRNFTNVSPLTCVTDKEWEVAWLIICGCSIRWIAKHFGMKNQTIDVKARNAYMKLQVFNKYGLLQVAQRYGWVNIVPPRYITTSTLIRIS